MYMFVYVSLCCICLYVCICNLKHALFFPLPVSLLSSYTHWILICFINCGIFIWAAAVDMNEVAIYNNMDSTIMFSRGEIHRKIYAVIFHLYSVQKHAKLKNILFRIKAY